MAPAITSVAMGLQGTASLTISAPKEDGGAVITSYLVTSIPIGIKTTYTPSQIHLAKISGLTPGTSYSFTAVAINSQGTSALSLASTPARAPTIPGAPSITRVIATGTNSAQLSFSTPLDNGGSPITSYVATSSPGSLQTTVYQSAGGTINITNLSHSTSYAFTLTAINVAGSSLPSSTSPSIITASQPTPPEQVAVAPSAPTNTVISVAAIAGVIAPVTGATPVTTSTAGTGHTGTVFWSPAGATFAAATSYTATISLTAASGYTLTGVAANFFSVAGATSVTHAANSGLITAVFPATAAAPAIAAAITTQPTGATSGSVLGTQPVIRIVDVNGNTVTGSSVNVVASIASGSGTLSGTTTATAVAGVATFTNLVITGTGDHVLTFTPETLTAVNSETLTVSLATQATLSITSLTTNSKAHPYSQALSITTSGGSGAGATTFAIASGGTASGCTLSNSTATASITATTVGTCLIQATKAADATYASATSAAATFTFQVGSASKAMMTTQPAGAVNGSAFTTQPVVRVTDSGDNTVTSFTGNVVASIASGTGTLSGTTTVAAFAGVATFTNLVITGTAGAFTLTFTPASLTAVTSSSFALAAGAATKVAITRASVGTSDNVAFTTQPQITIQDSGGNTVSSSDVVTATISGAGGTLIGTTTATASSGVATFTGLGIDGTPGTTYTITYTVSGLTVATATVTLVLTCANGGTCIVGDTGPGGGKVFYVGTFACGPTRSATCRYLEAAPTSGSDAWTDAAYAWGQTGIVIGASAQGTAIGTGYANTLAIVGNPNTLAARNARAYAGPNNLSDWFLPSKGELAQLYIQRIYLGGFVANTYWSSSEVDSHLAAAQSLDTGTAGNVFKSTSYYVRPVRAFTFTPLAAPAFTLSASSESRTVNTAATGFTINSTGGAIANFAISATPAGMSFSTSTGALTGTPTSVAGATAYTITATNATGSATATFTLTVTAALAAPAFTLSASSESRTVNTAATGFTINSTGGAIANFAISATPAGMSFSTSTGALTGTPTSVAGATAYTITATNATGSATQIFTLTVTATGTYLYYGNLESIGRASTQYSDQANNFITPNLPDLTPNLPDLIEVLTISGDYIFWTSGNSIVKARIDGTGVQETIYTAATITVLTGIATYGVYLYWVDRDRKAIGRALLDGTSPSVNFIGNTSVPRADTYGIFVTSNYIYWANYESNSIGRANLDGTDVNNEFIQLPSGGPCAIWATDSKLIWTNFDLGTLGSSNLGGTNINQSFIPRVNPNAANSGPFHLVADSSNIYWTNYLNHTIGRASLDGSIVNYDYLSVRSPVGISLTNLTP